MAKAISVSGKGRANSLSEWAEIRILFDDGTERLLPNITASLRQIMQLSQHPERYAEILAVNDGQ